jgi:hypothetical protein
MTDLEDEMRRALFGSAGATAPIETLAPPPPAPVSKTRVKSPRVRVILTVSKEFEGETEQFVYEADTLSKLTAEIDAKAAAKKKKYKYFELVSVQSIG